MTPVFLLVDPMQCEPFPPEQPLSSDAELQRWRESTWDRPVTPVPLPSRVPLPRRSHPYVVELSGAGDPWLQKTLDMAHKQRLRSQEGGLGGIGAAAHSIGGWLQTSLFPAQLAQQLAELMRFSIELALTTETKKTYLRVGDPRTLGLLRHVVGASRIETTFGRLQRWVFMDALGRMQQLCSAGEARTAFRFALDEWRRMAPGVAIHRPVAMCLGELRQRGTDPDSSSRWTVDSLFDAAIAAAQAAIQAARQWPQRFKTERDRDLWSALTLLRPQLPHLASRPGAVAALMQAQPSAQEPPDTLEVLYPQLLAVLDAQPGSDAPRP